MNNQLSISFKITTAEYARYLLIAYYRKPQVIIMGIYGLYSLLMPALVNAGILESFNEGLYMSWPIALMLLFFPLIITGILVAQKNRHPLLKQEMRYEFDDAGIHITGEDFKSDLGWSHISSVKEQAGFLLLKVSKREGYPIKKNVLTEQEIKYIKEKISRK